MGVSYLSAEVKLVYFTAPADWASLELFSFIKSIDVLSSFCMERAGIDVRK